MINAVFLISVFLFRSFRSTIFKMRIPKYQKVLALIFLVYSPLMYLQMGQIFEDINKKPNYYKTLDVDKFTSMEKVEEAFEEKLDKFGKDTYKYLNQENRSYQSYITRIKTIMSKHYDIVEVIEKFQKHLTQSQILYLQSIHQANSCLGNKICRNKHRSYSLRMGDTVTPQHMGIFQNLGLMFVMGLNIFFDKIGDKAARLAFIAILLIGILEFQVKVLEDKNRGIVDFFIPNTMTYEQAFTLIRGSIIFTQMLISAVSLIVSPSFEVKQNYLYIQILRLLFFLRVSNEALKFHQKRPQKKVDINKIVKKDSNFESLLKASKSGFLLSKSQIGAIDSNF